MILYGVAACSSYQSEGAWNIDGKGPSIWDDFSHDSGKGHVLGDETGDVSCDSYHRYKEDIALMKNMWTESFFVYQSVGRASFQTALATLTKQV